jgi:hypothetical protein
MLFGRSGVPCIAYLYTPTASLACAMAKVQSDNQSTDEDRLICIPGTNFGTEVTDDMNFAIGGSDEITRIHDVGCYDEKTNNWFEAAEINTRTVGMCYHGFAERMLLHYIPCGGGVEYLNCSPASRKR